MHSNELMKVPTHSAWLPWLPILVGLVGMYAPTLIALDENVWHIVGQGHGPVMFLLALWLAYERWPAMMAAPVAPLPTLGAASLLFFGLLYVAGRSLDILMFDAGSMIGVCAAILLWTRGMSSLKVMWFPLFFLLFLVPLPGPLVDALTGPLKAAVSHVSEIILYEFGYPIGRAGVILSIGPYQLMVADACAGLNSIFALESIGVFYMSIMKHTNSTRNILLASLILPISFISNVVRVITLVLVTFYFGDEAGQGFVHEFAGIVLIAIATILTIMTDQVLGFFFTEKSSDKAAAQ
jgi:exosortase B